MQTVADQSYALVKAATPSHASYISCLLHPSEASAESSNICLMSRISLETSQVEMPGRLNATAW